MTGLKGKFQLRRVTKRGMLGKAAERRGKADHSRTTEEFNIPKCRYHRISV